MIVLLARGNVPLSVTMTACSTLLSPVMTPLAMKLLAGKELLNPDAWIESNLAEMPIPDALVSGTFTDGLWRRVHAHP